MTVPFVDFSAMNAVFRRQAVDTFADFLDRKWYVLGEGVSSFETEYAAFNRVKHCVGVSNGLDALHLCLRALDIGSGDFVAVPSNTYIATVLAVLYTGAKPVFIEPDEATYNLTAGGVAGAGEGMKVIMPVHLYGQSCEMQPLQRLAEERGAQLVEDNAQSQGARSHGQLTGTFGIANATSFYPGKNLGALGDAGAVTTNDPAIADRIRNLRNYGSPQKYHNTEVGYNNRLDELQARILSVKLPYLNDWNVARQRTASKYRAQLGEIQDLTLPYIAEGCTTVYHQFVIRTDRRNELQEYLKRQDIGTLIHYPIPPHLQEALRPLGYARGDFPIAERLADTSLSLPIYPGLTNNQIDHVCASLRAFFGA